MTCPTLTKIDLTKPERDLVAQVATWDCFESQEYTASDIHEIYLEGDIVVIQFTNDGQTRIERNQFAAKIKEFKELTPEQSEFIEACVKSSKRGVINPRKMQATFSERVGLHLGTVWKSQDGWRSSAQPAQRFLNADAAITSVVTCTFKEWQEAVEGVSGRCYEGDGFWRTGAGRRSSMVNTVGMLREQGVEKTERQFAILEQLITIDE